MSSAAPISVVDDAAPSTNGKAYLLDNSGGGASAFVNVNLIEALVAGRTYRVEVWARSDAASTETRGLAVPAGPGTNMSLTTAYQKFSTYLVATGAHTAMYLRASAGRKTYFVLNSVKLIPGNHALQATAANRPLWKANAGKPYLLFDGSNDVLVTPFRPMASGTGLTMVAAFKSTAGAVQGTPLGGGSSVGPSRAYISLLSNGTLSIGWGTQVNRGGAVVDLRNQNHVVVVTGEASNRDIWLDGVNITADFAAAVGAPISTGAMAIGGRNNESAVVDQYMPGNVAGAVSMDRRVTPTEIARITADFQRTF
jgi:hypothetical protein